MSAPCDDEPGAPATALAELSGADPQPPVCQQRIGYEQERSSSRARAILPPVRSRRVHRSFSWPRSGDTKGCEGIGPTFSEPLTTRTWTHSSNGLPSCANSSAPAEGSSTDLADEQRRFLRPVMQGSRRCRAGPACIGRAPRRVRAPRAAREGSRVRCSAAHRRGTSRPRKLPERRTRGTQPAHARRPAVIHRSGRDSGGCCRTGGSNGVVRLQQVLFSIACS